MTDIPRPRAATPRRPAASKRAGRLPIPAGSRDLIPPQNEAEFGAAIYKYARLRRWLAYHTWNSRHSPRGFPDWTFARRGRLLFAELKIADTHFDAERMLSNDQIAWASTIVSAKVEYYLWIPADWPEILRVLD